LTASAADDAAYGQTVTARADKIVAPLVLADADQAARVRDLVARQYVHLDTIQKWRDARLQAAKSTHPEAAALEAAILAIRDETGTKVAQLHAEFLARLAAELTPAQIDQIKDGMTYGVMPNTYRVYLEMLPNLTGEQKAQIHAWLVEAREQAMDGFTSAEKHAWFGKYKGRINNYLAKAGIDLKQAEKDMLARRKAGTP
jgi:hypothetical protein